jgi:hypothetical protein
MRIIYEKIINYNHGCNDKIENKLKFDKGPRKKIINKKMRTKVEISYIKINCTKRSKTKKNNN